MGLETGNTIADLNDQWPLGTDPKSQGDDHIRLTKAVLKNDVYSKALGEVVETAGDTMTGTLNIETTTTNPLQTKYAGTDFFRLSVAAGNVPALTAMNGLPLTVYTSGAERMRIDPEGKITNSVGELTASADSSVQNIVGITQAAYDALTPPRPATTLYLIIG